ncbi:metal ABC transporter solute-binding protein, Zn/Mn family [Oceanobacter mangrovi]|uniref:metal ABC transporter solute-binding protein, Zn/Mn family n=1 Tax=Oceanobacter mangrovi TaxID=2862510 RepID=UPI001C8D11B8|nr:zinc ABC transporter substrate-binding protein [Oceanobacter mangrovi]
MQKSIIFTLLLALLGFGSTVASAEQAAKTNPVVVASLHPLALMAASVVPTAQLKMLVPPGMTPHDFSLRPSDIDMIQKADVIIWTGAESEPYLQGFSKRWPEKHWINVSAGQDVRHTDPHWWFDPAAVQQAQHRLASLLGKDSQPFDARLQQALDYSRNLLAPVQQRGFFVFHRAYDHWVEAMQLNQVGAFTLSPEQKPGLRTLQTMRQQLERGDVVCVFSEPEFSPAMVDRLVDGIQVGRAELDPMALQIALAADGYPRMLEDMAQRAETCLTAVADKPATALDGTVYESGEDPHHHHHGAAADEGEDADHHDDHDKEHDEDHDEDHHAEH